MLILVAVTITMAVNGGLFDYAGKATGETQNAIDKEQELANLQENVTVDELIDKYSNGEGTTGKVELPEGIKVGDYVNYTPDAGTYKVADGENGTGYTTTDGYQSFTTETGDSALPWRILSIDEGTGTIKLISATGAQTSTKLYLKGADGYNHGVDILNDLCKTLYSKTVNGKQVAIARSINIEDINEKTNYKVNTEVVQNEAFPNLYAKEDGYYEGGIKKEGGISSSTGLNDGIVKDGLTTYSTITGYTNESDATTKNVAVSKVHYVYLLEDENGETLERKRAMLCCKGFGNKYFT